jgi:hypothetical protein
MNRHLKTLKISFVLLAAWIGLSGCAPQQTASCDLPRTTNLDAAMRNAEDLLSNGCETHFDRYFADLLSIAEGDPNVENKRKFSDFLLGATDRGLLSKRQAQKAYNRYFNVKFVSMMGDYNNCSQTCPRKDRVLANMEDELMHKELGLLRIGADPAGYYRADRLFQETELVLEATCTACAARQ